MLIESFIFTAMPMPIIVRLITFVFCMYRFQSAMPARNQRWLQKFLQSSATIVMRTRDLCQRVVALARKMTLKAPWECEMPCMYHLLLCHLLGPATDGVIWTASYEQTGTWAQPRQLYELEGTLYKEICIILAGFWKLFIPIRPCSGAMPFNLETSLCSLCLSLLAFNVILLY